MCQDECLRTKEVAEQAGVDVVCQKQQQRVCEFERGGELRDHLVQAVQELHEDGRALLGEITVVVPVTAAICIQQVGYYRNIKHTSAK
jgi:predicted membrane protein